MVRIREGSSDHEGHGPLFMRLLGKKFCPQPWGQKQRGSCLGGREAGTDCWELLGDAPWGRTELLTYKPQQTALNKVHACTSIKRDLDCTSCVPATWPATLHQRWEDGTQRTLSWPLCTLLLVWLCYGHQRNDVTA